MAGQRQPIALVEMKGKKHLTKAEIEARKNSEVVAPNDKVKPPSYLTQDQKKRFRKLAKELLEIKLIANVDCDALARLGNELLRLAKDVMPAVKSDTS